MSVTSIAIVMQEARISVHVRRCECQTGNGRQKIHLTEVQPGRCVFEAGRAVSPSTLSLSLRLSVCLPVSLLSYPALLIPFISLAVPSMA